MVRRGEREVFALAGEGVRHILEAIRHPKARAEAAAVESGRVEDEWDAWSADSEDSDDEEEDTGLVDRCASVMADFWMAMPPDALQTWVLVDVESWPAWADGKHAPMSVVAGLREGVRRRLVAAGWNGEKITSIEERLRFANWDQYEADVGSELVRLEDDDHGFIFPP
jgi:hypothetical protein